VKMAAEQPGVKQPMAAVENQACTAAVSASLVSALAKIDVSR
jgi:hypothetical protein